MTQNYIKGILMMTVLVVAFQNCAEDSSPRETTDLSSVSNTQNAEVLVQTLFKSELNREPTSIEMAQYAGQINKGRSLLEVSLEVSNCTEARVRKLYLKHLWREPDPNGLAHWIVQVEQGLPWEKVVEGFKLAAECKADCGTAVAGLLPKETL